MRQVIQSGVFGNGATRTIPTRTWGNRLGLLGLIGLRVNPEVGIYHAQAFMKRIANFEIIEEWARKQTPHRQLGGDVAEPTYSLLPPLNHEK